MPQDITIPAVSFDQLLKAKSHKALVHGSQVHIVNNSTGLTEYILKRGPNSGVGTRLVPQIIEGRQVLVEEALSSQTLSVRQEPVFSEILVDIICEQLVMGKPLSKICTGTEMPSYATLCRWRRIHPWIDERLHEARIDRAERLRDEAMELIEGTIDKDEVAAVTLKHKAKVWAAGVDDPNRYSPKAKIEATVNNPTQILVYTGIGATDGPKEGIRDNQTDTAATERARDAEQDDQENS